MLAFRSAAPEHARPEEILPTSITTVWGTTERERAEVGIRVATGRRVSSPKHPDLNTTPGPNKKPEPTEPRTAPAPGPRVSPKEEADEERRAATKKFQPGHTNKTCRVNKDTKKVAGEDYKALSRLAATGKRAHRSKNQKPPHQSPRTTLNQKQNTARPRHPPTRKTMNLKQQGIKRRRDKSKALADRRACRDSQTQPKHQPRTQDEEPQCKH